jgi:hypothetical protein
VPVELNGEDRVGERAVPLGEPTTTTLDRLRAALGLGW